MEDSVCIHVPKAYPAYFGRYKDFAVVRKYLDSIEFADSRYSALDGCDALILITEWKEFRNPDFNVLADKLNKKIIFDGRNIYNPKIRNIGFELYQIGC